VIDSAGFLDDPQQVVTRPLNHAWFYDERLKPVVEELSEQGLIPVLESIDDDGEAKVHTLRFHDLRHTCVALLIAKGAQQYEVMEHLGHTSIKTTVDTYGHLFPSVRDRIRQALTDTWAEAREAPLRPASDSCVISVSRRP